MAVFRVERIKDYTVMSNHHLRNKTLSLKAKGLLSQMLSLPDDWDYTLKGLAAINKESVDAIRTAIWELENAGYVVRTRVRDERGCLRGCDYYVYEYPQTPPSGSGGNAESVPPMLEPLASDSAVLGNPMQLNKEIQNKEKQNTDLILSEGEAVRTKVRDNIELGLALPQSAGKRPRDAGDLRAGRGDNPAPQPCIAAWKQPVPDGLGAGTTVAADKRAYPFCP